MRNFFFFRVFKPTSGKVFTFPALTIFVRVALPWKKKIICDTGIGALLNLQPQNSDLFTINRGKEMQSASSVKRQNISRKFDLNSNDPWVVYNCLKCTCYWQDQHCLWYLGNLSACPTSHIWKQQTKEGESVREQENDTEEKVKGIELPWHLKTLDDIHGFVRRGIIVKRHDTCYNG